MPRANYSRRFRFPVAGLDCQGKTRGCNSLRRRAVEIKIVGAGPAGLYLAGLMKRHDASHEINVSMRWYERMDELVRSLTPVEFDYSYMTRTGRVDHAEMKRRDPTLAKA